MIIRTNELKSLIKNLEPLFSKSNIAQYFTCVRIGFVKTILNQTSSMLVLTASDGGVFATCVMKVDSEEEDPDKFEGLVDGSQMSDFVSSLNTDEMKLRIKDNTVLLNAKRSKFKLLCQNASVFPMPVNPKKEQSIEYLISSIKLNSIVDNIVDMTSDSKHVESSFKNSVFFDFKDSKLSIINASPIRMLYIMYNDDTGNAEENIAVLSPRDFKYLRMILKKKFSEGNISDNIKIQIGKQINLIVFKFGDTSIYLRLLVIKRPAFERVLNQDRLNIVNVNKEEFASLVKQTAIVESTATETKQVHTSLIFKEDKIVASVDSDVSSYSGEIDAIYQFAEEKKYKVNSKLLLGCINAISDDMIVLEMSDNKSETESGSWKIYGIINRDSVFVFNCKRWK